jgi:hypothetical protein
MTAAPKSTAKSASAFAEQGLARTVAATAYYRRPKPTEVQLAGPAKTWPRPHTVAGRPGKYGCTRS